MTNMKIRKRHAPAFKAQIVRELFKEDQTQAQIALLMSKRLVKIFGLIAVWIGLSQSSALACLCDCRRTMSANENLLVADAVFAGKVIAQGKVGWWPSWFNFKWGPPFIERADAIYQSGAVFDVTTVWKGDIFAKTSVVSERCCGYSFRPGGEYIVYARRFEGALRAGRCWRNNYLSAAGEDLAAFGAGKPPSPNPLLRGAYIGRLIAVSTLLFLLGWAALQARRKYGRDQTQFVA
jgi:hypothetical protein